MPNTPLTENSRAWVELKARLVIVEAKTGDATVIALQTRNAVVGSYDDSGTIWHKGIREQVDTINDKVDQANAKADSFKSLGRWAVAGLWAIVVGVALEFANNYFGWWGASHAALSITKGH